MTRKIMTGGLVGAALLSLAACGSGTPASLGTPSNSSSHSTGSSTAAGNSSSSSQSTAAQTPSSSSSSVASSSEAGGGGGGSGDATQMLAAASAAAKGIKGVHVQGTVQETDSSNQSGGIPTPTSMTMSMDISNGNMSGTIAMGNGTFNFVQAGGHTYMKGDAKAWNAFGSMGSYGDMFAGKWIDLGTADPIDIGSDISDPSSFFNSDASGGGYKVVGTKTINGHQAVGIATVPASGVVVYLQADGSQHLPLAVQGTDSSSGEKLDITFSNWGENVTISAPQGAVSIQSLMGGAAGG